jgi:hypothetical protein
MQNTTDELIDVDQAARILTLRPATVRAKVQRRELPVIHPAGTRLVRFRRSVIERLAGLAAPDNGEGPPAAA